MPETIEIFKAPIIEHQVKKELCEKFQEEKQITVHCAVETRTNKYFNIYPTTYLFAKSSSSAQRSRLIYSHSIPLSPLSIPSASNSVLYFTLVFAALSKEVELFDLIEMASSPHLSFYAKNILRNNCDVYNVTLNY